eukprot:6214818-Pleurochrysis_carterae.AAC.1
MSIRRAQPSTVNSSPAVRPSASSAVHPVQAGESKHGRSVELACHYDDARCRSIAQTARVQRRSLDASLAAVCGGNIE